MEESGYTSVRTKESWTYTCIATMARKYIVASATIVRITAESLSVLILWYVYQATTRNAESSKDLWRDQQTRNFAPAVGKVPPLTERSSNRDRNRLELEVCDDWAHIKCVDRKRREVQDRRRSEEY